MFYRLAQSHRISLLPFSPTSLTFGFPPSHRPILNSGSRRGLRHNNSLHRNPLHPLQRRGFLLPRWRDQAGDDHKDCRCVVEDNLEENLLSPGAEHLDLLDDSRKPRYAIPRRTQYKSIVGTWGRGGGRR